MASIDQVVGDVPADEPLLITIAVGSKLDEAGTTIACLRAIASARAGLPTVLILCENRISPEYWAEIRLLRSEFGLTVLESVVDRICPDRQISRSGTAIEVDAETYCLWTIEEPASGATSAVLTALLGPCVESGEVEFEHNMAAFKQRKAMLVNGPHTALALKTALQSAPASNVRTDLLLGSSDLIRTMIVALQKAAAATLLEDFPNQFTAEGLDAYCEDVRTRFTAFPDSAERILGKLIAGDYVEFVLGFHDRLLKPNQRGIDEGLVEEIANDLMAVMQRRGLASRFFTDIAKRASDFGL